MACTRYPTPDEVQQLHTPALKLTLLNHCKIPAPKGPCTVDQFNKKRVLLPQTLDISYSGVHGNKKFPTVEGPEVVRQGKRADVAWAGVEASRKFYFGILNFPVPESIEPAHMWIVDPRAGAGLRNFIFRF